ncbi:MAG: asparagine synthase-related protein [Pseudomonadota bacterium]
MQYENFQAYVDDYRGHTVSEDRFFKLLPDLEEFCERVNSQPVLEASSLDQLVRQQMDVCLANDLPICVMASGGADSSFLLSMIRRHFRARRVFAIAAETKGNTQEIRSLQKLTNALGISAEIVVPDEKDLLGSLQAFVDSVGRPSHDVAQPLHNLLVRIALERFGQCVVVDGQYADTLMFANPQNTYFDLYRQSAWLADPIRKLAAAVWRRVNVTDYSKKGAVRAFMRSMPEVLCWICRISPTSRVQAHFSKLLTDFDALLVMQAAFYKVLLMEREADKYRVFPDVVSPFGFDELFIHAYQRPHEFNTLLKRKLPVWRYLFDHHPEIAAGLRRRSFEPT